MNVFKKATITLIFVYVIAAEEQSKQLYNPLQGSKQPGIGAPVRPCPLCDSSVFSYCSEKLFHDSCCCSRPVDLPYQCQFADCSFLHANSCHEHRLITRCCCNSLYYKK